MTATGGPPASLDWGIGCYEKTAAQLEPAAREVVKQAAIQPGERVLDLGSGTGNAALLAAAAGGEVTGVDPASRLLEVARARAEAQGAAVTLLPGEAAAIPLGDGGVDVILSVFAVIFAPDPAGAAAEMSRVLAPTGRIVLSAWRPEGGIFEMNSAAMEAVRSALGAPPGPAPFRWHDRSSLDALFGPHGFRVDLREAALAYEAASVESTSTTRPAPTRWPSRASPSWNASAKPTRCGPASVLSHECRSHGDGHDLARGPYHQEVVFSGLELAGGLHEGAARAVPGPQGVGFLLPPAQQASRRFRPDRPVGVPSRKAAQIDRSALAATGPEVVAT